MRRTLCCGIALGLLAFAGCGGDEPDSRGDEDAQAVRGQHFVGELPDIDAFVGLVVRTDGSVMAYVCDGDELGMWATGRVDGDGAELAATAGSGGIDVEFDETNAASGTVTLPDGREISFEATRGSGEAGLYRRLTAAADEASGDSELTGWVVLADGRTKGSGGASGSEPTPVDKVSQLTIVQQCPRSLPDTHFTQDVIKTFGPPRYSRAAICGIPAGRRGSPPPPVVDVNLANEDVAKAIDEIEAAIGKQIADCLARQNAPERPLLVAKGYGDLKAIFNKLKADSRFLIASSNLYSRINEAKDADAIRKAETAFRALIPSETVRLIDAMSADLQQVGEVDLSECLGPDPEAAGPDVFTITRDMMGWRGSGVIEGDATYSAQTRDAADGSLAMSARVDVASDSYAKATLVFGGRFEVPSRVSRVTINVKGGGSGGGAKTTLLGTSCHMVGVFVTVYDGEEGDVYDSEHTSDIDCDPFLPAPPIPDPPVLLPAQYTLEFEPDHPGPYFVGISVVALAETSLFASTFADMYWFLDEIEVAFDRG